jgi:hypothetical protein
VNNAKLRLSYSVSLKPIMIAGRHQETLLELETFRAKLGQNQGRDRPRQAMRD